jgi:tetratricopeptide (TPR) repeat protein
LSGLGYLYKNHLNRHEESEECYLKALDIDSKYVDALNGLGNLYQDYFRRYEESENCYKKALDINPNYLYSKFNLIFLLRDKLNNIEEAKAIFDSLTKYKEVVDSYYLNSVLFNIYEKNVGLAEKNVYRAFNAIGDKLPLTTQDDWWRFAAVANKLGYNSWLLDCLEKKGYDKILAPYYVAITALSMDNESAYLGSKAMEIRNAAKIVLKKIKEYQ